MNPERFPAPGARCLIVLLIVGLSGLFPLALSAGPANADWLTPASACNRGLDLHVHAARLEPAPANGSDGSLSGGRLTLDIEFENRIAGDLVLQLNYPEAIAIGTLPRQLFITIDDRIILRALPSEAIGEASTLPFLGAAVRGAVQFPWPDQPFERVTLHYFHDRFGPIELTLFGGDPVEEAGPAAQASAGNDLFRLDVHEPRFLDEHEGEAAPAGMQWLLADLRGESLWQVDRPARAIDATAAIDDQTELGRALEYLSAEPMLLAVVDGTQAYPRRIGRGTLEPEPVFLPGRKLGGTAVFPVPLGASSVEIVAYFAMVDGEGTERHEPPPLRLQVHGQRAGQDDTSAWLEFDDGPIGLRLHDFRIADRFLELEAGEDELLAVIDLSMQNSGPTGGMMRVASRFGLAADEGAEAVLAEGVFQGEVDRLAEPFWLPPAGEPRRLQLVFRVPADQSLNQLRYNGVSGTFQETLPDML